MLKNWIILLAVIITSYLLGESIISYMNGESVSIAFIISAVLLIMLIIEGLTWDMEFKVQKDEMGKSIASQAAKISYYILIISMFIIWVVDRMIYMRSNDFGNFTLFLTLCFTMILYPLVAFIVSRKYR
jgi:magnesium-transporting ATPase (P-type)